LSSHKKPSGIDWTCNDREIGAITGMSPDMITRYSRFADQKMLAKAAARRLEKANTK
jgi:hypothetical protein